MKKDKLIPYLSFFVVTLLLCILFYKDTITEFPRAVHAWTQSDRYAIALKFLENGFDFFHPATYNLKGKEGITQVDFPIHEYTVAIIMKISGSTKPVIFRLYTLLYCIIGLFFLFKLALKLTKNIVLALIPVVFVFTLPVYCYNQAGFIPSAPAFSTMLIAIYFLYDYYAENKNKDLYLAIAFTTLAALNRLPFTIFLFALLGVSIFSKSKNRIKELMLITYGIVAVLTYYLYNRHLAKEYGSIFWMEPLYISSWEMFGEIIAGIKDRWLTEYFTIYHYILYIVAILFASFSFNNIKAHYNKHKRVFLWLIFSFGGAVMYFFVNGRQYIDHDYYFIDSLQLPLVVLFLALLPFLLNNNMQFLFSSLSLLLLIGASIKCYSSQNIRFAIHDYDEGEQARQSFIGSGEYLDSLGIPTDSRLLVIQAYTFNTPFIYMKRNGYTALLCRNGNMNLELLEKDYDYVIMPSRFIAKEVLPYAPYLIENLTFISSNGKISIYKYDKGENKTIESFMNIDKKNIYQYEKIFFDTLFPNSTWLNILELDSAVYSSPPIAYKNPDLHEYGISLPIPASRLFADEKNKMVIIKTKIKSPFSDEIAFVASVNKGEENLYYTNTRLNYEVKNEWEDVIGAILLPAKIESATELRLYFLNPKKTVYWLDDIELLIYAYN